MTGARVRIVARDGLRGYVRAADWFHGGQVLELVTREGWPLAALPNGLRPSRTSITRDAVQLIEAAGNRLTVGAS